MYDRISAIQAAAEKKLNFAVWNRTYRTGLWRDLRFPERRVYEDIAVIRQVLSRAGRVCAADDILCPHRKRRGSVTDVHSAGHFQDLLASVREHDAFLSEHIPEIFSEGQAVSARQSMLEKDARPVCRAFRGRARG